MASPLHQDASPPSTFGDGGDINKKMTCASTLSPMKSRIVDPGHSTTKSQRQQPWNSRQSLMYTVAQFLDGMSRAVILPFGPSLVNRLISSGGTLKLNVADCVNIPYPYAMVIAAYMLGKGFGTCDWFVNLDISADKCPKIVSRLAGMVISLFVFTLGSGLQSVGWLIFIRFVAATLIGVLCSITTSTKSSCSHVESDEDIQQSYGQRRTTRTLSDDFRSQEEGLVDCMREKPSNDKLVQRVGKISLGTIRIYLTASAVSILTGGLLYRHATDDVTFQTLTQTHQFSLLSSIFLIFVAIFAESILRCFFFYIACDDTTISQSKLKTSSKNESVVDWTPPSAPSALPKPASATKPRNRLQSTNSDVFVAARERSESVGSIFSSPTRRSRLETTDLEFFDCNSVLSDMEDIPFFDTEESDLESGGKKNQIAQYFDRKVVYADGTPAYVPCGDSPDKIPENYLKLCNGNTAKAEAMWKATQEWRRKEKVWKIHTLPNRWFPQIKKAYPHLVHGFSKEGYPIIYEQPGRMNLKQMFREGCDVSDMVRHYIFFLEYVSNHICTREEIRLRKGIRPPPHSSSSWGIMVVMDVKGAGLSHLSGDVVKYLKSAGDVNNAHYPLTLKRAFVINSPFWLAGAWSTIKGILPDTVKVDLLSSHQFLRALRERIDDDQIPPEYGGTSPYRLGEHPFEKSLYDLVEAANNRSDEDDDESFDVEIPGDNRLSNDEQSIQDSSFKLTNKKSAEASARRRRAASQDDIEVRSSFVSFDLETDNDNKKTAAVGGEGEIFLIASIIHSFWMIGQGFIESLIPLWILLPPELGGLGYAPSRSGVTLFSSAVVLLWAVGTYLKTIIISCPVNAPMRSFRIGAGSLAALLLLLPIASESISYDQRTDSILLMAISIIVLSCMVLSSMIGRTSSITIHKIAAAKFAKSDNNSASHWYTRICCNPNKLISDCESGRISSKLAFVSEVVGVLIFAPICAWCLRRERLAPFDGTTCLFLSSLLSIALYICSFSLHLNGVGDFTPHPSESGCSSGSGDSSRFRRCLLFVYEVISVSVSDMASLFDEANWSVSPLLGRQGSRNLLNGESV